MKWESPCACEHLMWKMEEQLQEAEGDDARRRDQGHQLRFPATLNVYKQDNVYKEKKKKETMLLRNICNKY